jgi:hypothetical protein
VISLFPFQPNPLRRLAHPQSQTPEEAGKAEHVQADGGWPRSYRTPSAADVIVDTPQIASWANQEQEIIQQTENEFQQFT